MNERIEELKSKCWIHDDDSGVTHFDHEKFAELILQDVLMIVDGKELLPYFDGYVEAEPEDPIGKGWWRKQETTKRVIKNHFGIEE